MKKILLIILPMMSSFLWGGELFENPLNETNQGEIELVFKQISSHPLVISDFTQHKTISRINRTINSSGLMIFDSSKGIAWDILKPFKSTTILTDNSMIQMSPGGQVRILSAEDNETFHRFSKTIQSVFEGEMEIILEEYSLYFNKIDNIAWEIGLIPKDSLLKSIIKSFEIHGKQFIETFVIHEANDDSILYEFKNLKYPKGLSQEESDVFEME